MADRRSQILEGATKAFGEIGYVDCRVEDILDAADVSRATFYKYFSSKEDVFAALDESFNSSFSEVITAAMDDSIPPGLQAEAIIDAYLQWLKGWTTVARIIWTDPTHPNARHMRQTRDTTFDQFVALAAKLGKQDGLKGVDRYVYVGLVAAVSEIGFSLVEKPRVTKNDVAKAREAIIHIIQTTLAPYQK